MATIRDDKTIKLGGALYVALELGWDGWKLAFAVGRAQAPRLKSVRARDLEAVMREIAAAKAKFGLPQDALVRSCYEAGRDGFWLHRALTDHGIVNVIVDSASIEVNRRSRRAKSDHLDATKLLAMLVRYHDGERRIWSVVRVPSAVEEDRRQLHRELEQLKNERTNHSNRIKGLLAGQGLAVEIKANFPAVVAGLRLYDGRPVPAELLARCLREFERFRFVHQQIQNLHTLRRRRIRDDDTAQVEKVRRLLNLAGVGQNGAWLLVNELFGWRTFGNRRELASLLGLAPTPYNSGGSSREQGISKSGNKRIRKMMVELAWCWLRWQPESELAKWYADRFARGSPRARKVGIVAVARKLTIALWKYLEFGEVPAGAKEVGWETKVNGREPAAA